MLSCNSSYFSYHSTVIYGTKVILLFKIIKMFSFIFQGKPRKGSTVVAKEAALDLERRCPKVRTENVTFTTVLANSADNKLKYFFSYFSQKTGFDISCKLSLLETVCMKCQTLFPGKKKKKKKNSSMLSAKNFIQSAKLKGTWTTIWVLVGIWLVPSFTYFIHKSVPISGHMQASLNLPQVDYLLLFTKEQLYVFLLYFLYIKFLLKRGLL